METPEQLGKYLSVRKNERVVVLCGAGLSVSAGIPDFRGSEGVYKKYGASLETPEDLFTLDYFRRDQKPFYKFCDDMAKIDAKPTYAHRFIAWLHETGRLHHCFTQNIDGLESAAGVPDDKLTECHGSDRTASCLNCSKTYTRAEFIAIPEHKCSCGGAVKPNITFFGENLPERFYKTVGKVRHADLVLIIGSRMTVYPFNMLPSLAPRNTPIVVIDPNPISLDNVDDFVRYNGEADEITRCIRANTMKTKEEDHGQQLDRIEQKLDAMIRRLDLLTDSAS